MTPRVLIVEDEPDIALGLAEDLTKHGFAVRIAPDGDSALRQGREQSWDVILLDVMLPHRDGFEVCRELRAARVTAPIIMLTARTLEAEKIFGLELGADDYVTKPFSPDELRARIKAVMRRGDAARAAGIHRFGDCEVDFDRAEIRRAGRPVAATALEFRLLSALIRARGRVLTRDQMIDLAWGENTFIGDRVVDTHVLNLRKKIEPDPAAPRFLRSVRGIGYRFDG
jgi:two-component system alkaline phosphatase synthesis response regulator PhoP